MPPPSVLAILRLHLRLHLLLLPPIIAAISSLIPATQFILPPLLSDPRPFLLALDPLERFLLPLLLHLLCELQLAIKCLPLPVPVAVDPKRVSQAIVPLILEALLRLGIVADSALRKHAHCGISLPFIGWH